MRRFGDRHFELVRPAAVGVYLRIDLEILTDILWKHLSECSFVVVWERSISVMTLRLVAQLIAY